MLHETYCSVLDGDPCDCDAADPQVQRRLQRRAALTREVMASLVDRVARAWSDPQSRLGPVMLHRLPSSSPPHRVVWRLTSFLGSGEPWGHTEYIPKPGVADPDAELARAIVNDIIAHGGEAPATMALGDLPE